MIVGIKWIGCPKSLVVSSGVQAGGQVRLRKGKMAIALLVSFLAVGWALTGVLYIFRTRGLRETIGYLEVAREELMQSALDAEKRAGVAETESQYMKLTLANVLQRPAVAVMTDENIQQLGAIIESVMKAPDKLN